MGLDEVCVRVEREAENYQLKSLTSGERSCSSSVRTQIRSAFG